MGFFSIFESFLFLSLLEGWVGGGSFFEVAVVFIGVWVGVGVKKWKKIELFE